MRQIMPAPLAMGAL